MILFKRNAHGQADGQVTDEAQNPIQDGSAVSEGQIMRYFVDGQHQRVVDNATEAVGGHEEPRPRQVLDYEQ